MVVVATSTRRSHSVKTAKVQRANGGKHTKPSIFWLNGLRSSMDGEKATALAAWCAKDARDCIRFDYAGHGDSPIPFETCTMSDWLANAFAVYETHAHGPQILVGSSMGGWIACLMADALASSDVLPPLAGMVLIAPAIDMTQKLIWNAMPEAARQTLLDTGVFHRPSRYGNGAYPITKALIEDGRRHLIGARPLQIACPVHILHGRSDPDVPWTISRDLCTNLAATDVMLTLIPDGDHRLSRPEDIAALCNAISALSVSPDAHIAPSPSR